MDESIIILPELEDTKLPNSYWLKYYQDLSVRTIWIDDEINDDLVYELTHYIVKWNREDKDINEMDRKPIKLMFNSPGGNLDSYASICSIIELSKTPIIGVAVGVVASAASLIFLSCHVRFALSAAYFILHKGSAQLGGDYDNIMNFVDNYKKDIEKIVNLIVEHSHYDRAEVEEKITKDWYVRADEAEEKGLVDEIIHDINVLL